MKSNFNKKASKIIGYTLIAVILFDSFIHEVNSNYALLSKGYRAFEFLFIGIYLLVVTINVGRRLISNKNMKVIDMLVLIIFICVSVYSLLIGGRNIPAISRDAIEGKYTTSLEISDKSKIVDKKIGESKYYISGTTLNGTEITLEVSEGIYVLFTKFYMDKNIKIKYWKHSKTLCSWSEGSD